MSQRLIPTFIFFLFWLSCIVFAQEPKLFIYHPATVNAKIIEKQIGDVNKKITVMVFGKYRDFLDMVQSEKPEGIILDGPLLQEFPEYIVKKKGEKNGKFTDEYILLSIGEKIAEEKLSTIVVGTVSFMSKKNMDTFVKSFFTTQPQIKYVPKIEDLLTILNFKAAQAVLIPESYVEYFAAKSKLDLKVTNLAAKSVEKVIVAIRKKADGANIVSAINKFPIQTNAVFGVNSWK